MIGQARRPGIALHQTNGPRDTLRKQPRCNRAEPTTPTTRVNWRKQNGFRRDSLGGQKQALHKLQCFFADNRVQQSQNFRARWRNTFRCNAPLPRRRRPSRAKAKTSLLQEFVVLAHGFSLRGAGSTRACSFLDASLSVGASPEACL